MLVLFEAIAVWLVIVMVTMLIVTFLALRWGRDPFGWLLLSAAMGPIAIVGLIGTRQSDVEHRPPPQRPAPQSTGRRRILIACDGSSPGLAIVRHVTGLQPDGVDAIVVTVLPHEARPTAAPRSQMDYEERMQRSTRPMLEVLRAAGIEARTVVAFGAPGEEIVRVADTEQADLVIVGRRGAGLSRALLGSTSEYVLKHATCPVTVVS